MGVSWLFRLPLKSSGVRVRQIKSTLLHCYTLLHKDCSLCSWQTGLYTKVLIRCMEYWIARCNRITPVYSVHPHQCTPSPAVHTRNRWCTYCLSTGTVTFTPARFIAYTRIQSRWYTVSRRDCSRVSDRSGFCLSFSYIKFDYVIWVHQCTLFLKHSLRNYNNIIITL